MALTTEYRNFLQELVQDLGRVETRRLFGFDGLFHEGTIIGIVANERVYLKRERKTHGRFLDHDALPFRFRGNDGREIITSYFELPARLYDDPGAVAEWARAAFEAALRSSNTIRRAQRRTKAEIHRDSSGRNK